MRSLEENKENELECPKCHTILYYNKSIKEVVPCPECGWEYMTRTPYDIPDKVFIPLDS